MFYAVIDKLQK